MVYFNTVRCGYKLNSEITHLSRDTDLLYCGLHDSLSMCYGAIKLFFRVTWSGKPRIRVTGTTNQSNFSVP